MKWAKEHPKEAKWLEEMAIRRELGGYYPKNPLKLAFISTILGAASNKYKKVNTKNRLKNLIRKNK